ncbi:MAG: metallophosphoesterase [Clostridia bacterium]|nr:metallophosphoesterase [Clostridia bacterium]
MQPIVDANIPYAFTFGNHDDQSATSGQRTDKDAMLRVYQTIGDCRTTDPVPSLFGTGTCNVPIYSSDGSRMAFNLWMVDSNTYQNPSDASGGYDNPHADQLAWMQQKQDEITAAEGQVVPSFVFQHIPMPEIYNLLKEDPNGTKTYNGKKYVLRAADTTTGVVGEWPCPCYDYNNTGEFNTLKAMGGVKNVFTGHDHLNDFYGTYDGITMTAVPGMTYRSYGEETVRGYGVIELDENDLDNYNYHSVKFTELDKEANIEEVYDDYDEITYADLKKNGAALPAEYTINGGNTFTYDATSASKSAVLKVRWIVGQETGVQFSFDKSGDGMSYPFGVWVKKPNSYSAGTTGAWHLKPDAGNAGLVDFAKEAKPGDTYDIEFGRLKVVEGSAALVGQYLVYLKVNGKMVASGYSAVAANGGYTSGSNDCQISNEILFADWGSKGNKITNIPDDVVYPDEDVFFVDFSQGNKELGGLASIAGTGSSVTYKKDTTLNRQVAVFDGKSGLGYTIPNGSLNKMQGGYTYEILYKLPRVPSSDTDLASSMAGGGFGTEYSVSDSRFEYWQSYENDTKDYRLLYLGSGSKVTNQWVHVVAVWNPEANGGRGQLRGYVNGNYVDYSNPDSTTLRFNSNSFYIGGNTNASGGFRDGTASEIAFVRIQDKVYSDAEVQGLYTAAITPKEGEGGGEGGEQGGEEGDDGTETYDTFDTLTLSTLGYNPGNFSNSLTSGPKTYAGDSASHSVVLKFKWQAKNQLDAADATLFNVSFDENWNYGKFGIWARADHLYFCYQLSDDLTSSTRIMAPIIAGTNDIELGRKLVTGGENKGKYYVYVKINGQIEGEGYTSYYTDTDGYSMQNIVYFGGAQLGDQRFADVEIPENYEAYDEITYENLKFDGTPVGNSFDVTGAKTFTYDATSPSYSYTFKFRWTAGNPARFNLYPDLNGSFPFSLSVKYPNQSGFGATAGPNGSWDLNPAKAGLTDMTQPIVTGKTYDVEYGRLKVASGKNAGKYYIYVKVGGELVASDYYDGVGANGTYGDGVQLNNTITFEVHGVAGTTISATPENEKYDAYDVVEYEDFLKDGSHLGAQTALTGLTPFSYIGTSPSHSVVLKYGWTTGTPAKMNVYLDKNGSYPFCLSIKYPNMGTLGAVAGPNGAWHINPANGSNIVQMTEPLAVGKTYNVEYGRLKVLNGPNAGKYLVYLKVDGKEVASYYYDGVAANGTYGDGVSMAYNFFIEEYGSEGTRILPYTEIDPGEEIDDGSDPDALYYAYDEIGYEDLMFEGRYLGESRVMNSSNLFTYRKTSPTGSVIFSYRWTVGTVPKFQISFDKTASNAIDYVFGAWLRNEDDCPNGDLWLQPGIAPHNYLSEPLKTGSKHDIEFARLKVKNGEHKGQYYLYFKMDGEIIAESYVAEGIVDKNGQYVSNPGNTTCTLSNEIMMTFWGSEENVISAIKDEILYGDADNNGTLDAADLVNMKRIILGLEEVDEQIAVLADMNQDGVIDVRDVVALKKYLATPTSLDMVSLQVGSDASKRTVVWYSDDTDVYALQLAKKADMNGRAFPTEYTNYVASTAAQVTSGGGTTSKMINQVAIDNLLPNTEYVYRIGAAGQWSKIYSFKTTNFGNGEFSFLVAGDAQIGMSGSVENDIAGWTNTLEKISALNPDAGFMYVMGDQTNEPSTSQYRGFFAPDALKSISIATVVGNHELGVNYANFCKMPNVSAYGVSSQVGAGSGDYWFIYDNVLFMTLNSNNSNVSEHEQFMTEVIAAHSDVRWKVVSMHHTLFFASAGHASEMEPFRAAMAPVFSALDIDVVLSAHDHNYARSYMMNGTTPTIPAGGVPSSVTDPADGEVLYVSFNSSSGSGYWTNKDYPYVAVRNQENVPQISSVDITDTSFTITTYRTNDMSVVDTFTINKTR